MTTKHAHEEKRTQLPIKPGTYRIPLREVVEVPLAEGVLSETDQRVVVLEQAFDEVLDLVGNLEERLAAATVQAIQIETAMAPKPKQILGKKHDAKKVLDTLTGIEYKSLNECGQSIYSDPTEDIPAITNMKLIWYSVRKRYENMGRFVNPATGEDHCYNEKTLKVTA